MTPGPVAKMRNGSLARLGFVERPQVAQAAAGTPPLALFVGAHRMWPRGQRSFTWAQRFCANASEMEAGLCGFMGGVEEAGAAVLQVQP